jgi:uncharacterized RDD family membrane protein YckC
MMAPMGEGAAEHSGARSEETHLSSNCGALDELLEAYAQTLEGIPGLPAFCLVRRARTGPLAWRNAPLTRLGTRYFVAHHAGATVAALKCGVHLRLARYGTNPSDEKAIEKLEHFERSLPPIPSKRLALGLLVCAGALGLLATNLIWRDPKAGVAVGDLIAALVQLNPSNFLKATSEDPGAMLLAGSTVSFFLWLLLRLPLAAFRAKRAAFNRYSQSGSGVADVIAWEDRARADGVFLLERQGAEQVAVGHPREVPWDLWVSGLTTLILVPLWAAMALSLAKLLTNSLPAAPAAVPLGPWLEAAPWIGAALFILVVLPAQLLSFRRIWRQRNGEIVVVRWDATTISSLVVTDSLTPDGEEETLGAPARRRDRLLALLIDLPLVLVLTFVLFVVVYAIFSEIGELALGVLLYLVLLPLAGTTYTLLTWARTLGKRWRTIRVIRVDQKPLGLGTILLREALMKWFLFGGLAAFTLGLTALINLVWMLASDDRRALQDLVAQTVVVRDSGPPDRE